MEMNAPRKFLSFIITGLLLVLFVSCQVEQQLTTPTSVKTPVSTATFTLTSTPTPLPPEIQYLRDNPHAGPIPEGAVASLGRGSILDIAYAPQSKQMVIASSIGLFIYKAPDFELIHYHPVQIGFIGEIEFSGDGSLLAVVTEATDLLVLDVSSWEVALNVELLPDENAFYFGDIAFSLQNKYIFLILEWPHKRPSKLFVYDLSLGEQVLSEEGQYSDNGVGFSPDGSLVAMSVEKGVELLDLQTREIVSVNTHTRRSWDMVEFSPSGNHLASWSLGQVVVLDVADAGILNRLSIQEDTKIKDVEFSQNGDALYVVTQDGLKIWDLETKEQVSNIDLALGENPTILIIPNGSLLIPGESEFFIVDIESATFPEVDSVSFPGFENGYFFDGLGVRYLAWHTRAGVAGFMDVQTMELVELEDLTELKEQYNQSIQILTESDYLISMSISQAIIWDLPNQDAQKNFEGFNSHFIQDILYNSANNLLVTSGSNDEILTVWDFDELRIIRRYRPDRLGHYWISPTFDEDVILIQAESISIRSPRVSDLYLWDITNDQPPKEFEAHTSSTSASLPPGERNLILWFFSSELFTEGSYGLWDLKTEELVTTLDIDSEGWAAAGLSDDRTQLILANSERVVTLDVETGKVIKSVNLQHSMTPNEIFSFGSKLISKVGLLTTLSRAEDHSRWLLIWDIETGQLVDQFQLNFSNGGIDDIAFISEDCILVSETSHFENDAVVWNIATKDKVVFTHEIGGEVRQAIFILEEDLFITNTLNGPVFFWEMPDLCD